MTALIIAAGKGDRLKSRHHVKPLLRLLGVPLIEHVMAQAGKGGVTDFVVVTGYHSEEVRQRLDDFALRTRTQIRHVANEEWEKPNGLSVLAARGQLDAPFFLLMSDHLFDPTILRDLATSSFDPLGVTLAVDFDLQNPTVDLGDVTRVQCDGSRIRGLGKGLTPFNGYDTGIFYCSPALFDAIDESVRTHGDASLSGGMNVLAALEKAHAYDVSGRFWLDVDDPRSADLAAEMLQTGSAGVIRDTASTRTYQ